MKQHQIKLGTNFIDSRGVIQNILSNTNMNAVALITSVAGSERSNHYHKNGDHHLYVISGSLKYYERDINEDGSKIEPIIFETGEMFYTPPNKVHKVIFLEDTVLLSLGKEIRTHEAHEEDLIRVEF